MWGSYKKKMAMPLLIASKLAVVLAAFGAFTKTDIWLAPTQWLLVAILLAVWAVYDKLG